ncbi:MAG: alpha/beta hydrolase [Desulfobacterales bacterium]|nr:alpha/beta hydrolase [Desulfobacterales bacterium]MCP4159208.1 alpha/beta hydrolase [Deltaproteobacteria bacterium]
MKHNFFVYVLAALILLIGIPASGLAVSEGDYQDQYNNLVKPDYLSGYFGSFTGVDDIKIAYVKYDRLNKNSSDNAYRGALVIQHGDTESYRKYAELVYDLKIFREKGYDVFLMDVRGQGYSERMLFNHYKDYVKDFDDYVTDFSVFIETIVKADNPPKLLLISHSLGGCITFRYMQKNPDTFDAAVMSSPMLKPWTGDLEDEVAYKIAKTAVKLGLGKLYAAGESYFGESIGATNKFLIPAKFKNNEVTNSPERWTSWNDIRQENCNELDVNGHAFNFVYESMKDSRVARDPENVALMKTPMLILVAEDDKIVDTEVYTDVEIDMNNAGGSCETKYYLNDSMHELFMEKDIIRNKVIEDTLSFFADYLY